MRIFIIFLVIQHTNRVVTFSLTAHHIFPHYLIKGKIFGVRKILLNIKCVFWFSLQLLSATFPIIRRIQRDMIKKSKRLLVKFPLLLSDFNQTDICLAKFKKKNYRLSNFNKAVQWEPSCAMRTKGRAGRHDEANSRCLQFLKSAYNGKKRTAAPPHCSPVVIVPLFSSN